MKTKEKILWSGRFKPELFIIKEDGRYHLCEEFWNDHGRHVNKIHHSISFDEAKSWAVRKDEDA